MPLSSVCFAVSAAPEPGARSRLGSSSAGRRRMLFAADEGSLVLIRRAVKARPPPVTKRDRPPRPDAVVHGRRVGRPIRCTPTRLSPPGERLS